MSVHCYDTSDIKCEQLQAVPSKNIYFAVFFSLDEFNQELNFCFIIIGKFGVQTLQKWQVSNRKHFAAPIRVSDGIRDDFVGRHNLESHLD